MVRGWVSGVDPLIFDDQNIVDASNGLALFLCQVLIILTLCTVLGQAFKLVNQPRVVGELLAGVVLGPTAFGNRPGFAANITPTVAMPILTLTSNIGLIFFILIVGLETDTDMIKKNARKVAWIALPGMAVPFAVSVGLARFVYERSTDQSQPFTTFFLFVATVMAVTSLSVLSRVISEMRLVNTLLGSVTIAAGAMNDLIGYLLLALGSALAGGGKQINALYQLLVALAMFLCQWFVVRPLLFWLIKRSRFNLEGDAKQRVPHHLLCIALVGSLISAFITEANGLHPILGALLFGISCPHGNFAIMITEEIETLSVQILLPLYFVISGLKADFKTLNSGLIWGQLILIFAVVYISKFGTTTFFTRIAGFSWRESAFVAALMQSKSIIELIILNAGREANVLNAQVYSMFFVTFILSTLTVKPMTGYIRGSRQRFGEASEADEDAKSIQQQDVLSPQQDVEKSPNSSDLVIGDAVQQHRLDIIAALATANPSLEALTALMRLIPTATDTSSSLVSLDVIRFQPLVSTAADVLRQLGHHGDQILTAVRLLAYMQGLNVQSTMTDAADKVELIASTQDLIDRLVQRSASQPKESVLIVVPWEKDAHLSALQGADDDNLGSETNRWNRLAYSETVAANIFSRLPSAVATGVLVDGSLTGDLLSSPMSDRDWSRKEAELGLNALHACNRKPRLFVAFFGGSDDRRCVGIARALAANGRVDAFVISTESSQCVLDEAMEMRESTALGAEDASNVVANMMTVNVPTEHVASERQADVRALFEIHNVKGERDHADIARRAERRIERRGDLTHVTLSDQDVVASASGTAVEAVFEYIAPLVVSQSGDMLLVGRGKRQQRTTSFQAQIDNFIRSRSKDKHCAGERAEDMLVHIRSVLGSSCEAVCRCGINANVLVVQSARSL